VKILERLFARRTSTLEDAMNKFCLEGAEELAALLDYRGAPSRISLVNANSTMFAVCAGGAGLDLVAMAKRPNDLSRALYAVGIDALLFEGAAWCLSDFSDFVRRSIHIPDVARPILVQSLSLSVERLESVFDQKLGSLLVKRVRAADAIADVHERVEFFGSLLIPRR
jgi:hypothetical protein